MLELQFKVCQRNRDRVKQVGAGKSAPTSDIHYGELFTFDNLLFQLTR